MCKLNWRKLFQVVDEEEVDKHIKDYYTELQNRKQEKQEMQDKKARSMPLPVFDVFRKGELIDTVVLDQVVRIQHLQEVHLIFLVSLDRQITSTLMISDVYDPGHYDDFIAALIAWKEGVKYT